MESECFELEPIENLVTIHDSDRIPVKKSDRKPGPYPYYGASGITDYVEGFIFDGDYVLLAEDGDNLRSRNTPIAFMASGKFWVNNHAHILKGKNGNDTDFICYALQIADITSYISGSTRPKITQRDMKKIPIYSPSPTEQKAIAHILGSLDDKIALNRQMNETLEAMAQALFKSWFVDFDPVIDNALAAGNDIPEALASQAAARQALGDARKPLPEDIRQHFPSRFEFTEEMGWIPEGWGNGEVGCLFDVTMGQSPPGSTYNESSEGMPFFQGKTDFGFRYPVNRIYCTEPKRLANKGDTLVSVRAPVGDVNMASEDCCIGRGVGAVRHKSGGSSFTYYSMRQLREHFKVFEAEGTVFGSINQRDFKALPQLRLEGVLVKSFEDCSKGFDEKIRLNTETIRGLTKLRDTLLPKLLSGELRIPDAEKLVEEAVA